VSLLARTLITAHRARARAARLAGRAAVDREDVVRDHAADRSFLDVGCMWSVHGRIGFVAEEAGATAVTGVDVMGETPEYQREHAARGSAMRFVQGDLHDPATLEATGVHDVVWCSGVLYHAPHPLLTLERLRSVCGSTLLLATEVLPDHPGVPGACVFYPALSDADRRAYASAPGGAAVGVTTPYDPGAGYGNWFWGITPSALDGLLRVAGFAAPDARWWLGPFHLIVRTRPV
jgi:SAM-dependent methyltransferase